MARFDVHRSRVDDATLLLKVQADFLDHLATTVALPLRPAERVRGESDDRLKPTIEVGGEDYVVSTTEIVSLPNALFGAFLTNVEREHRDGVTRALDILFQGF